MQKFTYCSIVFNVNKNRVFQLPLDKLLNEINLIKKYYDKGYYKNKNKIIKKFL